MKKNFFRSEAALKLLNYLHESRIPYSVQRNLSKILAGEYKDVDLIVPLSSWRLFLNCIERCKFLTVLDLKYSVNRASIKVVTCPEYFNDSIKIDIDIDIDFQVVIFPHRRSLINKLRALCAPSVTYNDLTHSTRSYGIYKVTFLSADCELFLLENHIISKNKKQYASRILEIKSLALKNHLNSFHIRNNLLYNLIRRYLLLSCSLFIRYSLCFLEA